jgi:hypothetical protein
MPVGAPTFNAVVAQASATVVMTSTQLNGICNPANRDKADSVAGSSPSPGFTMVVVTPTINATVFAQHTAMITAACYIDGAADLRRRHGPTLSILVGRIGDLAVGVIGPTAHAAVG